MELARITEDLATLPDDQLVAAFQKGRKDAFPVLFMRYSDRIMRYCAPFLKNREDAKDCTQEVFIKVLNGLAAYRSEGRFQNWVFTIARRHLIDSSRKREVPVMLGDEAVMGFPSPGTVDEPQGDAAGEMRLPGLTAHQREVLFLRLVEGFSYEEIAGLTGMTPGSLRNLVSQAVGLLRKELSP